MYNLHKAITAIEMELSMSRYPDFYRWCDVHRPKILEEIINSTEVLLKNSQVPMDKEAAMERYKLRMIELLKDYKQTQCMDDTAAFFESLESK